MENKNTNQPIQDDGWFDDILGKKTSAAPEIGMDESALYHKDLRNPADMELERIIAEAKAMDEGQTFAPGDTAPIPSLSGEDSQAPEAFAPAEPYAQPDASLADDATTVFDLSELASGDEAQELMDDGQYYADGEEFPEADADPDGMPPAPPYLPEDEEYYEDADGAAPEDAGQQPPQKRRPRWKKGAGFFGIPHILSTLVWLLVVVAIGVSLGRLIWVCAVDVLAFGKEPPKGNIVITIREGDTMEEIANKLEKAGLIEYPSLFVMYVELSGNEPFEVGNHVLSPMIYDYHAIKTALEPRATAREVIEVVIPEGYTCQQTFALLEQKGVCTAKELEEYAANGDLNDYWFLTGVERGDKYCLEGYLFPDTYQFYKGHDAELVLEKMLDNFDYRFTDIMLDKVDVLNDRMAATLRSRGYSEDFISQRMFGIHEVVTVASMIERETANGSESYEISSVIYNRLTNPGNFPFLNIDATVIYGMGGPKVDPVTGDNLPLTKEDLETDTPYNTYTRKGMIPGPISNPGRNSLNAALDPNNTDYYYYVYDPAAGHHLFARTEAEHAHNKAKVQD